MSLHPSNDKLFNRFVLVRSGESVSPVVGFGIKWGPCHKKILLMYFGVNNSFDFIAEIFYDLTKKGC